MVVQHNLTAMNSNRMLGVTTGAQKKSSEKLSSGYKINRAADDAAGLSISEKMRRQIRGLTQASANAEDGISAVQTAEGALNEVHDMLQRMNELANKAANGTNSKTDRQSIQDEISQLTTEIDRVSETTKFNELYLMKGGAGTKEVKLQGHDAGLDGILSDQTNTATFTATLTTDSDYSIGGKNYHIYDAEDTLESFQSQVDSANTVTINGTTYTRNPALSSPDAAKAAELRACAASRSTCAANLTQSAAELSASAATISGCAANLKGSAATIKGCAANLKASAAAIEASAANLKASAASIKGCADNLTASAKDIQGCADNKTAEAAEKRQAAASTSGASAAALEACAAQLEASAASIKACAETKKASAELVTACAEKKTASAGTMTACAEKKTASAESVSACAEVKTASAGTMAACATKKTASSNAKTASAEGKKASAEALNASARRLAGEADDADGVKFIANEKEYLAGELKSMIVDGAKVGINGVKERTAVDTVNNLLNKTLDEVKGLIKDALNQANRVGVDDTTAVSVTDAVEKGGDQFEYTITKGSVTVAKDLDFNLHVGADADLTNKIGVGIAVMDSKYLGVHGLQVVDDSGNLATYAIDAIEDAITKVNEQRSALGAVQNRLEHTIKNVDNVVENTTAAESQIRDTDMASEMVRYSNNNILMQAGQSMLAQANQSNQGVLSLLG